MDQAPTGFFGKLRNEQRKWIYDHLGFVKTVFWILRAVIYAFMFTWIGAVIWLFSLTLRDMLSSGQPLIINGERSTWVESLGFVVLVLGMGVCGVASMLWALRLFRKTLASPETRKKEIESESEVA